MLLGWGVGCSKRSGTVRVADATQSNVFTLMSGYSGIRGQLPSGITLHVHGQLAGTGYVFGVYSLTQGFNGAVDWRIYQDFFETSCTIRYVPVRVTSGRLNIDYQFH